MKKTKIFEKKLKKYKYIFNDLWTSSHGGIQDQGGQKRYDLDQ